MPRGNIRNGKRWKAKHSALRHPVCSELSEHLLCSPVLDVCLAEDEVEDQAWHVNGNRNQEDISPAKLWILEAGNYKVLMVSWLLPLLFRKVLALVRLTSPLCSGLCGLPGCSWNMQVISWALAFPSAGTVLFPIAICLTPLFASSPYLNVTFPVSPSKATLFKIEIPPPPTCLLLLSSSHCATVQYSVYDMMDMYIWNH